MENTCTLSLSTFSLFKAVTSLNCLNQYCSKDGLLGRFDPGTQSSSLWVMGIWQWGSGGCINCCN